VNFTNEQIQSIVQSVVSNILEQGANEEQGIKDDKNGKAGVFEDINAAIDAAQQAFFKFQAFDIQDRRRFTDAIRTMTYDYKEEFSRMTVEETKMGRVEHKIRKHINAAKNSPGVEFLQPQIWSGKNGQAVDEYAPFGVIGNITPSTHPGPVMINSMIIQLCAGNTLVFNQHPSAKNLAIRIIQLANQYMVKEGAPENLVTCVSNPTIETAKILFDHPNISLLAVTGGPVMVNLAMKYPKRVIAAGPGNPPVLIDETADLHLAAKEISASASYDNNVLCTAEKEIFVVENVFETFMSAFEKAGNVRLTQAQMNTLADKALTKDGQHYFIHPDFIGRNANVLAQALGLKISESVPMLFGETDKDHPWVVAEQMTSCIPVVRVKDFEGGLATALKAEHGFRHSASIFTKDMNRATLFAKKFAGDVTVINGGTWRGNGSDLGEGYFSHTIAAESGEGICTPLDFCRKIRIMVTGALRYV
jgi:aldehyde dehydrogenase